MRNSFLAAALELRNGFPEGAPPQLVNPEMVRAMSTDLLLDYMAIRLDSSRAKTASPSIYSRPIMSREVHP